MDLTQEQERIMDEAMELSSQIKRGEVHGGNRIFSLLSKINDLESLLGVKNKEVEAQNDKLDIAFARIEKLKEKLKERAMKIADLREQQRLRNGVFVDER